MRRTIIVVSLCLVYVSCTMITQLFRVQWANEDRPNIAFNLRCHIPCMKSEECVGVLYNLDGDKYNCTTVLKTFPANVMSTVNTAFFYKDQSTGIFQITQSDAKIDSSGLGFNKDVVFDGNVAQGTKCLWSTQSGSSPKTWITIAFTQRRTITGMQIFTDAGNFRNVHIYIANGTEADEEKICAFVDNSEGQLNVDVNCLMPINGNTLRFAMHDDIKGINVCQLYIKGIPF